MTLSGKLSLTLRLVLLPHSPTVRRGTHTNMKAQRGLRGFGEVGVAVQDQEGHKDDSGLLLEPSTA